MNRSQPSPVTFDKKDVEIIARETLYRGFFSLNLYRFRHRLFNGEMSPEITREIFERGHAAVLLPYDPVRDEVVLIEQLRIAAVDTSNSPWLLEMVAGMIETGESVEDVCRREAQEEAGVVVGRCKPVLSYLASPGAPANVCQSWSARWTPAPPKASMAWRKNMRISASTWSAASRLTAGWRRARSITPHQ